MRAVEDARGITHAVVLKPFDALAGITACNVRFSTAEKVTVLGKGGRSIPQPARMTPSEAEVTCMACITRLSNYDGA